jgi:hypothetical protein
MDRRWLSVEGGRATPGTELAMRGTEAVIGGNREYYQLEECGYDLL